MATRTNVYWKPEDMKAWRQRVAMIIGASFSQTRAAAALGAGVDTVKAWESGRRPIPKVAALACNAVEISLWFTHTDRETPEVVRNAVAFIGQQ